MVRFADTRPASRILLVAILLVSLALFCLDDLVRAAAPAHGAEAGAMDCGGVVCDEASGCSGAAVKPPVPAAGIVAPPAMPGAPAPVVAPVSPPAPPGPPGPPVVLPAPRSPPAA